MAWISTTYVDNALGGGATTQRLAIAPSSDVFNQFEASARSAVVSYMLYAGYSDPGSTLDSSATSTPFLQRLVLAQFVREAFGMRRGIKFPPSIEGALQDLDAFKSGRLPIPGMTPGTATGYGGVKRSATTGADGRPQVFNRGSTSGW